MEVRRAVVDDAAQLAEVHVRTWQVGYRGQLPDAVLDVLDPADRLPQWREALADAAWPQHGTLVAECAPRLLGFARIGPDPDPGRTGGRIYAFYVLPEVWRRGVGRRLMAAAHAALAEAGFDHATLWVLATNDRAIRFYERTGWYPDGTERMDEVIGVAVRQVRYRCDELLSGRPARARPDPRS